VLSGYFVSLQAFFLLVVAAGLSALWSGWLRQLALVGGAAAAALIAASAAGLFGAAFTAERDIAPDAIWSVYEAHSWLLVGASLPASALFGGVALGSGLPRWLRFWCGAVAVGYVIGGFYPFGGELEGGVGGIAWFFALILGYLWVGVVSARSLLSRARRQPLT